MYCDVCEMPTKILFPVERPNDRYWREMCPECYQAFLKCDADHLNKKGK